MLIGDVLSNIKSILAMDRRAHRLAALLRQQREDANSPDQPRQGKSRGKAAPRRSRWRFGSFVRQCAGVDQSFRMLVSNRVSNPNQIGVGYWVFLADESSRLGQ